MKQVGFWKTCRMDSKKYYCPSMMEFCDLYSTYGYSKGSRVLIWESFVTKNKNIPVDENEIFVIKSEKDLRKLSKRKYR